MRTFSEIIEIIKAVKAVSNDADVAELLKIKPKTLATAKTRNSIPYDKLTTFCNSIEMSLNWLLLKEGWAFSFSTSHQASKWLLGQLDTDVNRILIVTYEEDTAYGFANGFVIDKKRGIISMQGSATRSGYPGEGPRAYRTILESLYKKKILTYQICLNREEASTLDNMDISRLFNHTGVIANAIDAELSKVFSAEGNKNVSSPGTTLSQDDFIYVPMNSSKSRAGSGTVPENPNEIHIGFRKDWIQRHGDPQNMSLIRVIGDSMEPTLFSGDIVLVDHNRNQIENGGGIYAVSLANEVTIKRLQQTYHSVIIISDNPKYSPIELEGDSIMDLTINGKVIWLGHEIEH